MAVFPDNIKTWVDKVDKTLPDTGDDFHASHINEAYAEIIAIQTELHGATSDSTANKYIKRDAEGRAKVAAPVANDDIARKDTVDVVQQDLNTHKEDYATQRQQDNLKVALVEKGLNDYKSTMASVNVNQEATQTVTGYGTISLPKNAANGQVSAAVRGRTLKNELNYNRDTWAEWGLLDNSIIDNGRLKLQRTSTGTQARLPNTNFKPNTKYGFLFYNHESTSAIEMASSGAFTDGTRLAVSSATGTNRVAIATTLSIITENRLCLKMFSNSSYAILSNIRAFELPTGSEIENDFNTMTADQLAIKYPYIKGDSTKSTVSASRLKSVGKNLLCMNNYNKQNGVTTILNTSNSTIAVKPTAAHSGILYNANVIPNTNYTFSNKGNTPRIRVTGNGIDSSVYESTKITFNSGNNHVLQIFLMITATIVSFNIIEPQLEKGTVATPYEPYTESTQYLPNVGELRSLPNGVKDEVRVSGGKAELVKRTNKAMFTGTSVYQLITSPTNLDRVRCRADDLIGKATWFNSIEGKVSIPGLTESANTGVDDISDIGTFFTSADQTFFFCVAKGTYSSLEDAQSALAGLELTYQLAEEIVTPIDVSGTLLSYPSGTVYLENAVADAGIYTDKITVLHQDLPIANLEKLSKVDYTTGLETELDPSTATIAEDKLSFTHPGLVDGDIVFFTYFHSVEGTQGELSLTYYDSRHVIKDSVTEKFYKVVQTVADGVLSNTLVEV